MGKICRGHNYPFLTAVETFLKENGIAVLVQDLPQYWTEGGRVLTVPDADHNRAIRLLREAGLDPRQVNLSSNS